MLKVYDKKMDFLYFEDKKKIHQQGLWHKTVGGIVYNKKFSKIYFQTIYPKASYTFARPDYIDFSIGGHIEDKESVKEALLREGKEEFGLNIKNATFLGLRICDCTLSDDYKIKEFQYFYAIETKQTLAQMTFDKTDAEVKSVIEIDFAEFLKLLYKEKISIKANETVLDKETRASTYFANINITADRIIPDFYTDNSILDKILALKELIYNEL